MKNIAAAAFSARGAALALIITKALGGTAYAPSKFADCGVLPISESIGEWTKQRFEDSDAIIFVSACGIAVRAIAPFVNSKESDPAVIVLDDMGENVISLLSGHIGGANELAGKIASLTRGNAVITTATDVHGLTAVDEWAKKNNCAIENIKAAKEVSSEILAGHRVGVAVTDELQPAPWPVTLWLRPRDLVIGVGCKRETSPLCMKEAFYDFMEKNKLSHLSVRAIASIDIKKDEAAIRELAEELSVPFKTYCAAELSKAEGKFVSSDKVLEATGVDNVCERSAVLETKGDIVVSKTLYKGITFAAARDRRQPDEN